MTSVLLAALAVTLTFVVYAATLTARAADSPHAFLDGGGNLPGWAVAFAATGVAIGALGLSDHLRLVIATGLQASHVAVALVLVALAAALVQKRLWLVARITGAATLGTMLGAYYQSVTLRVLLLIILALFTIPVVAVALAEAGRIVAAATEGAVQPASAILVVALFLFLAAVIGGWRSMVYAVAGLTVLTVVLLALFGGLAVLGGVPLAVPTPAGTLPDLIPGVIQFSAGIGREAPAGGPFTTIAILTAALAVVGIVLSPAFVLLGTTSARGRGFAVAEVWLLAGVGAGILLLTAPLIAGEAARAGGLTAFLTGLARIDPLLGAAFAMMLLASLLATVAFLANAAGTIATQEFLARDLLPGLTSAGVRLTARLVLAAAYLLAALTAAFAPLGAALAGALALPLAVQLMPAVLGLCWLPWIGRGAVHVGLVFGILFVVFTEPPGLLLFDAAGVPLPWGRWPLTVHSAAWGLAVNLIACLLVAIFDRIRAERDHRRRLHDELRRADPARSGFGGATWALTLVWTFLALGPGAILGNSFFSQPIFTERPTTLGIPSLFVWQILAWLTGVLIVWWVAYRKRMAVLGDIAPHRIDLGNDGDPLGRSRPDWLSVFLDRVATRRR